MFYHPLQSLVIGRVLTRGVNSQALPGTPKPSVREMWEDVRSMSRNCLQVTSREERQAEGIRVPIMSETVEQCKPGPQSPHQYNEGVGLVFSEPFEP